MSRVAHALRGCSVGRNVLSEHVLDEVVAKVMGTEAALSRVQLLSGASPFQLASVFVLLDIYTRTQASIMLQAHMR